MLAMSPITILVIADPSWKFLAPLGELPADVRVITSYDLEVLRQAAPEADVILSCYFKDFSLLGKIFPLAKRVRWVHSLWAGVEKQLTPEIIASPVPFSNGKGAFAIALAEWVIGAMIFFGHDSRRLIQQQESGLWQQFESILLHGQTLGIVGYGEIGRAIAQRARPFGMKIAAIRRRPDLSANDPLIDVAYPPEKLQDLMGTSDYIALATPLTPQTKGMIGAAEIAAMKPSAVLINVGRGPVIQESALIPALQNGKIHGAALDVFETEPLPAGHPFYSMKNVLLSPHSADQTPGWNLRAMQWFLDNLARFRQGQPLENLVDKHAGY